MKRYRDFISCDIYYIQIMIIYYDIIKSTLYILSSLSYNSFNKYFVFFVYLSFSDILYHFDDYVFS